MRHWCHLQRVACVTKTLFTINALNFWISSATHRAPLARHERRAPLARHARSAPLPLKKKRKCKRAQEFVMPVKHKIRRNLLSFWREINLNESKFATSQSAGHNVNSKRKYLTCSQGDIDRRRLNQLTLYRKIKINSQKTKNNSQNFPAPRRPRHAPMSTNHSSHWACYIPKYLEICKIAAIHSGCALRAPKFSHNVNSKTHHSFMQPGRKIDTKLNTGTLYRLNRTLFSWSQI